MLLLLACFGIFVSDLLQREHSQILVELTWLGWGRASDDSIYRKYRYIVFDIDISYRIVSSKNIEFFDISRY